MLVIGNGVISRGIQKYSKDVTVLKRPEYDIRNMFEIPDIEPGTAVICAAITGFGMCEKYPEWSRSVNVTHTSILASRLHSFGWNVVMLSSNAAINPQTEYGKQKKDLEDIWEWGPILRLPKVLSHDLPVIDNWIRLLRMKEPVFAFSHGIIQPVPKKSISDALNILKDTKDGLYEIAGPVCTWLNVALSIATNVGADESLVRPHEASATYDILNNKKMVDLGWQQYSLNEAVKFILNEWSTDF